MSLTFRLINLIMYLKLIYIRFNNDLFTLLVKYRQWFYLKNITVQIELSFVSLKICRHELSIFGKSRRFI